jgi:hypothetical protein
MDSTVAVANCQGDRGAESARSRSYREADLKYISGTSTFSCRCNRIARATYSELQCNVEAQPLLTIHAGEAPLAELSLIAFPASPQLVHELNKGRVLSYGVKVGIA